MLMTKKEMVEILSHGKELVNSTEYQKTNCDILAGYQFNEIDDFGMFAQKIFEGEKAFDFAKLQTDMERTKVLIARELVLFEKRGGLTHQELADKIMQGIVNGALGIHYGQIAPYCYGYEVTFGGDGLCGDTKEFLNRWECYSDFFDIGNVIAGKIEQDSQHSRTFGEVCKEIHIKEILGAIEKKEQEKVKKFVPEKDTSFEQPTDSSPYHSIATVMDVHAGKGLDGIVLHHYHGTKATHTSEVQNSLVEMLVCLKGFCLDQLHQLNVPDGHKEKVVDYLQRHGLDISTPEKLEAWIRSNPEKCALAENRERKAGLDEKITEAKGRATLGAPSGAPVKSLDTGIQR